MLGVEHGVDGGQRDVLVAAAVTGDEVRGRAARRRTCPRWAVDVAMTSASASDPPGLGTALCAMSSRNAWPVLSSALAVEIGAAGLPSTGTRRRCSITSGNPLRVPEEAAVGVGREQRHVEDVGVDQADAEHGRGLRLDLGPVADVAARRRRCILPVEHAASATRPCTYSRRNTWCDGCDV